MSLVGDVAGFNSLSQELQAAVLLSGRPTHPDGNITIKYPISPRATEVADNFIGIAWKLRSKKLDEVNLVDLAAEDEAEEKKEAPSNRRSYWAPRLRQASQGCRDIEECSNPCKYDHKTITRFQFEGRMQKAVSVTGLVKKWTK